MRRHAQPIVTYLEELVAHDGFVEGAADPSLANAMRIGGDFLSVLERQDGSLALLIGDVSGRGAAAAGLGATLRSAWLATIHAGISTREIPAVLDRLLEHHTSDAGVFATACFVEVDRSASEVRAVSAGHDPPLLITPGPTTTLHVHPGPALGLGLSRDWPLARVDLPRPGALLLYTDGLTESRDGPGVPRIGIDGLRGRIDAHLVLTRPAQQALDELLGVSLSANIHQLDDDLAVMLVAPRPHSSPRPGRNVRRRPTPVRQHRTSANGLGFVCESVARTRESRQPTVGCRHATGRTRSPSAN